MRGIRGVAAAGVAAVSALALAACGPLGSSASGGDKTDAPTAAPAATDNSKGLSGVAHAITALDLVKKTTTGVHSAKVESVVSMGSTMSMTGKGEMDWSDGLVGDMSITYTGGAMADQLKKSGMPATMAARYLPDAYYANMGPAMAAQLGGKHWIKYGYDSMAKLAGGSGAALKDAAQNFNPVKSVDVALASPNTKSLGTETVRGVQATHYRATLDLQDISGRTIQGLTAEEQQEVKDSLTKAGMTTETIDLWVSKDNLPVKAVSVAAAKIGMMKSTVYYSDFGTTVSTQPPAAFDTVDFADAMKQGQQS
jgi:hypothetical protein